jgi:hypothetical protein
VSVTIVRADLGPAPDFVYVADGQTYLVVDSKRRFDREALEREAQRIEQMRPTKSYIIRGRDK